MVAGSLAMLGPIARHQLLLAKPSKLHSRRAGWRSVSLVCTLAKVFDAVLGAVMDRSLQPLPAPIIGFVRSRSPAARNSCRRRWRRRRSGHSRSTLSRWKSRRFLTAGRQLWRRRRSSSRARSRLTSRQWPAQRKGCSVARGWGLHRDCQCRCSWGCARGAADPSVVEQVPCSTQPLARWVVADEQAVAWCPPASQHSLLSWVDKLFLLGSEVDQLQRRPHDVQEAFAAIRREFSADSLEFVCSPSADAIADFRLGRDGPRFVHRGAMRVLGVMTDGEGHDVSISSGFAKRMRCWPECSDLRACSAPPAERERRLFQTVGSCALYGGGLWSTSSTRARPRGCRGGLAP